MPKSSELLTFKYVSFHIAVYPMRRYEQPENVTPPFIGESTVFEINKARLRDEERAQQHSEGSEALTSTEPSQRVPQAPINGDMN